jgi:hypothetical protein
VGAQDTAFVSANGTRRVRLAGTGTVAQAVRSARLFAQVFAAVARIGCSRGNAYALARRTGQVTASASAVACAFATDTVDALAGFAIARVGTGHAGLSLSARTGRGAILRSGDTFVARLAVRVALARDIAGPLRTEERSTVDHLGIPTSSLSVADARGILGHVRGTGRNSARGVLGKQSTGASAITETGRVTGRNIVRRTARVRHAGAQELAAADRTHFVAREARARAGDVAAVPIGAVTRGAIIVARTEEAVQLEATASSGAGLTGRTECAGRALPGALAGLGIARVRSAGSVDVDGAGTLAVACLGIHDAIAITGAVLTEGAVFVLATRPNTIAGSVLTAGGWGFGRAEARIRRLDSRWDEGADAERAWQIACLAAVGTG